MKDPLMASRGVIYLAARSVWRRLRMVHFLYALSRANRYDACRFWYWSHGTTADRTEGQARHAIYKAYHAVEKGLSLKDPRPNFGAPKMAQLIEKLRGFSARYDPRGLPAADSALHSYQRFNQAHKDGRENAAVADYLAQVGHDDQTGGVKTITRTEIAAAVAGTGPDFFNKRHSVRQYDDRPVDLEIIHQAIDMARKTPSVCNRQGVRAHLFGDAQAALAHQPGNRGFGHLASRAIVITADLQAFSGAGERNQPFVDGGMFAMSVLYGLHAMGLGACPLAWSAEPATDRATRSALGIPDSEVIIMFISVGNLPETLQVACAHRFDLKHFIVAHEIPSELK